MKTPREILLERHKGAEVKLDTIREGVLEKHLAASNESERTSEPRVSFAMKLWQELVWRCRRVWVGMAAVWVGIIIFGWATADREEAMAQDGPPTQEIATALKEQRQMMAQLLDRIPSDAVASPRVPGPRSEVQPVVMVV